MMTVRLVFATAYSTMDDNCGCQGHSVRPKYPYLRYITNSGDCSVSSSV